MNWYKKANKWKDSIPGGRADKKKPSDYEKSQVGKGLPAMERKLEKKKPARSGRYPGQQQGDEYRPDSSVMSDIFNENDLVEGEFVKVLSRMANDGDWDSFNNYLQKLRNDGHSASRVNSMMSRAMHKVKL